MKNYFLVLLSFAFIFVSCSKDPCEDVVCVNGVENEVDSDTCICECDSGFEGNLCENEIRQNYYGTYQGPENCGAGGSFTYSLTVAEGDTADVATITLNGLFGDPGVSVTANLTAQSNYVNIQIPEQTVSGQSGNYTFSGNGNFNFDAEGEVSSVSLSYNISATGGISFNCTGEFDRQ
ncbi:MAG: hypothetical protein EA412_12475 [Chitinophagaceae bacterium]|nr:MAG: hypothetical protein EA412_12475 [Chitinophagaceae bacterium]